MRTYKCGMLSTLLMLIGCGAQTEVSVTDKSSQQFEELKAEFTADPNGPTETWADRFLAFAEDNATDQVGIDTLLWITRQNRRCSTFKSANDQAIARLYERYPDHPETAVAVYEMRKARSPRTAENLDRIAQSNDATLRGLANFSQGYRAFKRKRHDEAKQLFQRVRDKHLGLTVPNLLDGEAIRIESQIAQCIFEMDSLQVGMQAPDIVGTDLYGEELKLSDYRGKVVLLTFWGDW